MCANEKRRIYITPGQLEKKGKCSQRKNKIVVSERKPLIIHSIPRYSKDASKQVTSDRK